MNWADCRVQTTAVGHFVVVLEPADFPSGGSFPRADYWARLPDGCSGQAGFPDAPQEALPLLAARWRGLADSVVGYSLELASPVWPEAPVSQREPHWLLCAASASRLGRSLDQDEPAALAVSPRTTQALAVASPSRSRCVPPLLAAALQHDSRCWPALPTLLPGLAELLRVR